jgi:hypothetical protein
MRAGPDVELDGVSVPAQVQGQRRVGAAGGILRTDVDPERRPGVGIARPRGADDVVAGKVLGIVERAGSAAGPAWPERG